MSKEYFTIRCDADNYIDEAQPCSTKPRFFCVQVAMKEPNKRQRVNLAKKFQRQTASKRLVSARSALRRREGGVDFGPKPQIYKAIITSPLVLRNCLALQLSCSAYDAKSNHLWSGLIDVGQSISIYEVHPEQNVHLHLQIPANQIESTKPALIHSCFEEETDILSLQMRQISVKSLGPLYIKYVHSPRSK